MLPKPAAPAAIEVAQYPSYFGRIDGFRIIESPVVFDEDGMMRLMERHMAQIKEGYVNGYDIVKVGDGSGPVLAIIS